MRVGKLVEKIPTTVLLVKLPSFPPEMLRVFVRGDVAFAATLTVTVIWGKLIVAGRASERVHVSGTAVGALQDHPVPLMDAPVMPVGSVSVTVTCPNVAPGPALPTEMV